MKPIREALALVLRTPRLWGAQFLGNVVIFLLYAAWLRLPEARWWDVVLNALLIVLVLTAALTLHGGTLNYFQSAHADRSAALTPEFKKALKHVLALAVWAAVFFFLWFQVDKLGDYQYSLPGYLRAELPSWLRKHTTDTGFTEVYMAIVGLLQYVVLPGLLLPLASLAAGQGFRGFLSAPEWKRPLRRWGYWVALAPAVIVGEAVIRALLNWKMNPQTATLGGEEVSLFFRLLACYLIGLFAWLWVCSMLGRLGRAGQPEA